jgi:hypothetical protein
LGFSDDFQEQGDVTVTTTDAAAARRHIRLMALAVAISLAGVGLAGCGGGGWSLFGNSTLFGNSDVAATEPAPEAKKAVVESALAKVAVNAIVGPPDPLGKQLSQEFASALEKQRVAVAAGRDEKVDFHLRPYILAAREKAGTKVSYVLDVSDPTGKRVNRFAGEELVPPGGATDPWASITPSVAQLIAAKATGNFAQWLASARGVADNAGSGSPAGVGAQKQDKHEDVASASPPRVAPKTKVSASPPTGPTTGSIGGAVKALVPPVAGAPGDGKTSLAAAIQRELQTKGVALADRPAANTYRVEGTVTLGAAREGKQAIQIEWVVKDPQGKRLGTVSQKNDIPEGSLDGPWGGIANQAASAAVQGIFKLLPPAEGSAVN